MTNSRISDWVFAVALVAAAALVAAFFATVSNYAAFPGKTAEIEQLREDVSNVSPETAEDVVGQVVQTNREIATNKKYNSLWWADVFIPDGWDDIEPIPVPRVK